MSELPHDHGQSIERKLEQMPDTENFRVISDIFKLLSDCSRVRIFWLLCHCEECVVNIAALVEMTTPAVSHHLRQLRDNGLIVSRIEGKEVYYTAAHTEQAQALHHIIEHLEKISSPGSTMSDVPEMY